MPRNVIERDIPAIGSAEREALLNFDVRTLYEMGVHGLLLRPFTIMHKMSDPDYIKALRGE